MNSHKAVYVLILVLILMDCVSCNNETCGDSTCAPILPKARKKQTRPSQAKPKPGGNDSQRRTYGSGSANVTGFHPTYGPIAGGTRITVTGVSLGELEYYFVRIRSETELTFVMPRRKSEYIGKEMTFTLTGNSKPREKDPKYVPGIFTYRSNPSVSVIHPLSTLVMGGTTMTVSGESLSSVTNPKLEITTVHSSNKHKRYRMKKYHGACRHQGSDGRVMKCITPRIKIPDQFLGQLGKSRTKRDDGESFTVLTQDEEVFTTYVGVVLDGLNDYRYINNSQTGFHAIKVYVNPPVVEEMKEVHRYHERRPSALRIQGSMLGNVDISDYVVEIGKGVCNISVVYDNAISCNPPSSIPEAYEMMPSTSRIRLIRVNVGTKWTYAVGYVEYMDGVGVNTIVTSTVTASIAVAILLVVGILVVHLRRRSRMKAIRTHSLYGRHAHDDSWSRPGSAAGPPEPYIFHTLEPHQRQPTHTSLRPPPLSLPPRPDLLSSGDYERQPRGLTLHVIGTGTGSNRPTSANSYLQLIPDDRDDHQTTEAMRF